MLQSRPYTPKLHRPPIMNSTRNIRCTFKTNLRSNSAPISYINWDVNCYGTEKVRSPCSQTVGRWIRDTNKQFQKMMECIPIQVGSNWNADEIFFKSDGEDRWLFGVMDSESRFLLGTKSSPTKQGFDATALFDHAMDISKIVPSRLTTDKLAGFANGFSTIVSRHVSENDKNDPIPTHVSSAGINKKHVHNNVYERFNGTVKDVIKRARGFKVNTPPKLGLFVSFYNFIRPHSGIGNRTPAEVIGIKVEGPDKWSTLLAFASVC